LAKGGGHGVILLTSKDGKNCGLDLISNFLTDSTYDLTCLNNIYTLDFEGNDRYNTMYIGTSDLYDGEITTVIFQFSFFSQFFFFLLYLFSLSLDVEPCCRCSNCNGSYCICTSNCCCYIRCSICSFKKENL